MFYQSLKKYFQATANFNDRIVMCVYVLLFQNCVDRPFDMNNGVHVTKNSALADEMAYVVKTLLNFTEPMLGKQ